MNFAIGDQASGLMGLLILAGAVALVATLVFLLLVRRVRGARDRPVEETRLAEGDDVLP